MRQREIGWSSVASTAAGLEEYFQHIAQARFVIRKVFRIVDEQAKREGLDSIHHQALIQIFGAQNAPITVTQVAELVDIAPAFASRVIKNLEEMGLVDRVTSEQDRRVTLARVTEFGRGTLSAIDEAVSVHVRYFQAQLSKSEKASAMSTFAFYVGFEADEPVRPISHHDSDH